MKTVHWEESSGATVTVSYYYPKRSFVVIIVTIPQNARILLKNLLLRNFLTNTVVYGNIEVAQAAHHATIYGIKIDVHTHRIRQD